MDISLNVSDGLVTMGPGPGTWYTGHTGHCHTCLHQSWHFIREDIGPRQIADLLLVCGYHTDLEEKYCKPQITMTTDYCVRQVIQNRMQSRIRRYIIVLYLDIFEMFYLN